MPYTLTFKRTHCSDVIKRAAIAMLMICSIANVAAQQEIHKKYKDSIRILRSQKDFSPKDTVYIDLLSNLGYQLRYYNSDSLFLLSNEALKLSKDFRLQRRRK